MIASDPPPPDAPTEALPGTEEKLFVLAWRAANGFSLWHPADAETPGPRRQGTKCGYHSVRHLTRRVSRGR